MTYFDQQFLQLKNNMSLNNGTDIYKTTLVAAFNPSYSRLYFTRPRAFLCSLLFHQQPFALPVGWLGWLLSRRQVAE
jgi:hypothetical protein